MLEHWKMTDYTFHQGISNKNKFWHFLLKGWRHTFLLVFPFMCHELLLGKFQNICYWMIHLRMYEISTQDALVRVLSWSSKRLRFYNVFTMTLTSDGYVYLTIGMWIWYPESIGKNLGKLEENKLNTSLYHIHI